MQRIRAGTPAFFESLVVRLLVGMGYGGSVTDVSKALTGGSGDGGVDGVIDQDRLGLDRIYVQAKRYADGNSVGGSAIRDFFGSLNLFKATKGVFVTASTFSSQARETAAKLGTRIVLIDGHQLTRLMIRHGVGCRIEETLDIKKIDEEFSRLSSGCGAKRGAVTTCHKKCNSFNSLLKSWRRERNWIPTFSRRISLRYGRPW